MTDKDLTTNNLAANKSWRDAFSNYAQPRVVAMLFFGFSSGLPYVLVFWTLAIWLREGGVTRTAIGFISWAGITYSIKFIWAPIVDRLPVPVLTRALGRRRSWMILGQLGIVTGIIGMAFLKPDSSMVVISLCALLIAFSSATQDISIDAYRIEAMDKSFQASMSATYIAGYKIASVTAGAFALYIAEFFSWPIAFLSLAALMCIGVLTALISREPERKIQENTYLNEQRVIDYLQGAANPPTSSQKFGAWFIGAVVCPFVDFFTRNGKLALLILLLISLYRISDIILGVMANTFYIDMGYTKTEIANISKIYGIAMVMVGAFLGGILVSRFDIMRPLLLGAVSTAIINLLFAYMAMQDKNLALFAFVIAADNISAGIATTAFIAYMSSLTNSAYTATQYALFSSLMTLLPKFIGGFSGIIVDSIGFVGFFIYASAVGIPTIILCGWLLHQSPDESKLKAAVSSG